MSKTPEAVLRPERRVSWLWVVPLAALAGALWLGWAAWSQRGLAITVLLPDGHGLKVGDAVRFRGIVVGEVEDVRLTGDLQGVAVGVRLAADAEADRIARVGTRFWVVRPEVGLTGVKGVETLLGPRYLAVLPGPSGVGAVGDAPDAGATALARQREFVGLAEPPVAIAVDPGDLEIILEAGRRGSLQRGAPVTYRQMRVGTVVSVGLASDGSIVEARARIEKAYRGLVRDGTRFWDAGGVRADLGLRGLSMEIDSLEEFIMGGVALATPPPDDAGAGARTGHRFTLHAAARDEWLEWEPTVAVGSSLLPPGSVLPQPLRATIEWKQGFLIKGARSREGWVLQTPDGLIGPADLLAPAAATDNADAQETVRLDVAGRAVTLAPDRITLNGRLALLDASVGKASWPAAQRRVPEAPEDCIAVADPTAPPLPLAASRLTAADGGWTVDPAVSVDATWHGACIVSRADGRLVGLLLVEGDSVQITPIPW